MKIGLDYQRIWAGYSGGTTSFALGLLEGFSQVGARDHFMIFAEKHNAHLFTKYANFENFEVIVVLPTCRLSKKIHQKFEYLCFRFKLIKVYKLITNILNNRSSRLKDKVDILYVPTDLTSYDQKIPTVCSLHDIQQVHFPEFFSTLELSKRFVTFNACAQSLNILQASSEFMRSDFLKYFNFLSKENLVVIPEGVNIEDFRLRTSSFDINQHYGLPELFLYYPGQLWPHKNHLTVLKALAHIKSCFNLDIPIVLTGQKYSSSDSIFEFAAQNSVNLIYLGVVPYEHVRSLYQAAHFTITAVLYESSSIPIRESAAAGTPIIASNTPPNVELSKKLALNLFDPASSSELSDVIFAVWENQELIKKQTVINSKEVEYFSWKNIAKMYLECFEKTLNK